MNCQQRCREPISVQSAKSATRKEKKRSPFYDSAPSARVIKKRSVIKNSVLCKFEYYHSLIYPFLIYGNIVWGNTYKSTLGPIINLQKKALRIITFSNYYAHTHPLFKKHKILKLVDLIFLFNALFMHDYYTSKLSPAFSQFFVKINKTSNYNTRLASKETFCLPAVRTNYGKFSIRFQGVKVWNSINDEYKPLRKSA